MLAPPEKQVHNGKVPARQATPEKYRCNVRAVLRECPTPSTHLDVVELGTAALVVYLFLRGPEIQFRQHLPRELVDYNLTSVCL